MATTEDQNNQAQPDPISAAVQASSNEQPATDQSSTVSPSPTPAAEIPTTQPGQAPSVSLAPDTSSQVPTPKKSKAGLIITLAIIVIAAAVLIGYFVLRSQGGNATEQAQVASTNFLSQVQSGSASTAYAQTSPAFQANESSTQFADYVAKYSSEIRPDYTVLISKQVSGEDATFTYNAQTKTDSTNVYVKVVLQNQSGVWKVQSVEYQTKPF